MSLRIPSVAIAALASGLLLSSSLRPAYAEPAEHAPPAVRIVPAGRNVVRVELKAADIAGVYACQGSSGYTGTVTITRLGDTYQIKWMLGGDEKPTHTGVGIREGDVLAASWGAGESHGVIVYRITAGRVLKGRWTSPGTGTEQTEELKFTKPLAGADGPAAAPGKPGDRALVQWSDGFWYPATVQEAEGKGIGIAYDDGSKETTTPDKMAPDTLGPGSRVEGNWKGGGTWYPGRITQRDGKQVHISYDDGDEEDTTTAFVRVERPAARPAAGEGNRLRFRILRLQGGDAAAPPAK